MIKLNGKKIRKWLRILHRDLGYFAVGITLVYAISGIILNHQKTGIDPAYKTISYSHNFPANLSTSEFIVYWSNNISIAKLNKVIPQTQSFKLFISGGEGVYNTHNGQVNYEIYSKRNLVYFINILHKNTKNHWTFFADLSAAVLIFFALSGLVMIKGKKGFIKRGLWFMIAGILIIIVYIWI